ncbi:hypothetical protein [Desulfosporosinus sp. Sb-LF]|uniref:hypothetical protein n=1 Tax=Desulfosporosinus sp. Sb-LF TaxID=2560027 RepID=UPI00107F02E4|nr:hypothetical protein [Desulfosporosinus sp. Sb-LF]TGE32915.1 hypothetical protein E4K68_08695 [Desulfosporosinus sp. Sb-LF]
MKTCYNCGLGMEDNNGLVSCYKYKTLSESQEEKSYCIYYIEKIFEDDEPLALMQYLLLVEQELGKRKMKISINNGLRV